jgi:hypothetical protein
MKARVTTIPNLVLSLAFCMGLTACNKEDFYEKEYIGNPIQNSTTGSVGGGQEGGVDGKVGGTQGGVEAGVNGGTTGSTTGSSTTGGTTTGNTTGGVDGSTTSGSTSGSTTSGSTTGSTTSGTTTGSTTSGTETGSTTSGSTTGSTTSGSTTGSTVGGTTGGTTTGGTTGSTTGGTTGVVYQPASESFRQNAAETKKLDILWIIDNSGSMADEQTALGTNFSAFIDDFITKDVDFKMAITTTDTSSSSLKGKMVTGSDTKLTSAKAKANETQFKSDFKTLIKQGTSGSGYEKGLEASEGFVQKYASTFLRSDAYLAVVVISDEQDQSPKAVNYYSDLLKSYKSEGGLVKVYSIVDIKGTPGITGADVRYTQASQNTAGTVTDIHQNFYATLSDLGNSIISLLDSFALSNNPVAGSLKVYVNGIETTSYTYDAASRSIKFDAGNLPPVGADIKVTYLK